MHRTLIVLAVVLGLALALLYTNQDKVKQAAYDKVTENMFVPADTDDFDPGPAVGSHFPGVHASYEGRVVRQLTEFAGPAGTALVASRSLSWCPFCMKQMIQLQEHKAEFDAAGIALVGMTYDPPEVQRAFAEERGITIPLLSDIDAMSFKTLGILNAEYHPGDDHYGIPYPGMIIIDPEGIVVGKLFVEAYSSRVDSRAALSYARQALSVSAGKSAI